MQSVFDDMLHLKVECYINDLVDHLEDLHVVFDQLRKYNFNMNPIKCAFEVTFKKFLHLIILNINPCKLILLEERQHQRTLRNYGVYKTILDS
ncbi:hypothetical protein CDL12_21767 [Handroanthus impetiginosus]|uniref:Uncharacterized protein n=1 Tax=Handroanthus impetiginosus TaxID=429701 RepID=A0A2G9GK64_9LAMI|nr:hypothetical protein CDL12_21767 [Handroanthus impetiginosus]